MAQDTEPRRKGDVPPKSVAPADLGPPPATDPAPGSMVVPEPEGPPKLDPKVMPVEAADPQDPGLPGAKPPPGGAPIPSGKSPGAEADPFTIHPDRLGLGKQRVQLSVEVRAKPVINLGKESEVRLVVKNESNADASGVSLVYLLPDALQFVSSVPDATPFPGDKPLLQWMKPMLAAGAEWQVVLKVVAKEARACEHAATVTARAGSRANATVQEPKLKVEAQATPGRLLKGGRVTFNIAVHNPGTGPARDVIVQAKLSGGLRLGNEEVVEQTIAELKPGQRIELDPLVVDTVAGGQQTCTVEVRSPDVTPVVADQRVVKTIDVTKADLVVKIIGEDKRFTGQSIDYKLTVNNPGTAPARKVKVVATLPTPGKLIALPNLAEFDRKTRKLVWTVDQVEPGQSVDLRLRLCHQHARALPGDRRGRLGRTPPPRLDDHRRRGDGRARGPARPGVEDPRRRQDELLRHHDHQLRFQGGPAAPAPGHPDPGQAPLRQAIQHREGGVQVQPRERRIRLPRVRPPGRRRVDQDQPGSPGHRQRPRRLPRLPRPRRDARRRGPGRGRDLHPHHRGPVQGAQGPVIRRNRFLEA